MWHVVVYFFQQILISSWGGQLDGLCFLVAYQLNSLFIFMMLFLFSVQLRNKYDDDDVAPGGP